MADGRRGKVAIVPEDSRPMASYTLDDAVLLTEDATRGHMTWRSADARTASGYGHVRLLLQFKNAMLYWFRIEQSKSNHEVKAEE